MIKVRLSRLKLGENDNNPIKKKRQNFRADSDEKKFWQQEKLFVLIILVQAASVVKQINSKLFNTKLSYTLVT